jgi:hypothetical protein
MQQNYSHEFYVQDIYKLTQSIFLCNVSCGNETKFALHVQVATLEPMLVRLLSSMLTTQIWMELKFFW